MPSFLKTDKDEKLWEEAKEIVKKDKGRHEWPLVTHIYKQKKKAAAQEEMQDEAASGRELSKKFFDEFGTAESKKVDSILTFASVRRDNIRSKMLKQMKKSFPIKERGYTVELEDPYVDESEASPTQERLARLEGKSLFEKVKGTLILKDADGKVIEKKEDFVLAKLPYFTDDHSFIIDGTMYSPRNQLRTRPGVYTRRRGNDDLEASFNMAKGANFRVALTPETGIFKMEFGTTKIPLYPILRAMGYPHSRIADELGSELAKMNEKTDAKRGAALDKFYKKVIPSFAQTAKSDEQKVSAIKQYFEKTEMDGDVNRRTLGKDFSKLSPDALLSAASKLKKVFNSEDTTDDRDSLAYQKMMGIEDFLSEKVKLDTKDVASKVRTKIRFPKKGGVTLKNILPSNPFGRGLQNFLTTSSVITTPTGINPIERLDNMATVTRLGEGAIGSERAIPMEARRLHGTHLGVLGPLRTPESSRSGIDVRSSLYAAKDENGILHTPVRNLKTNKIEYKSVDELEDLPLAFPEQDTDKGSIDVLYKGKTKKMKPGEVKYQLPNTHSQFSITTNLAPMIESMQGNRTIMSSKMVTQALPLVNSEEPLVQVSPASSKFDTMEEQAATMIESVSPVDGEVEKVDKDYIYVKGDKDKKTYKIRYQKNVPYSKTRFNQDVTVKKGQKVKALEQMTQSNFTRNKKLALGTNLKTAYIANDGYNTDDAVTIREGAREKLKSEHFYTFKLQIDDSIKLGGRAHAVHCPNIYTKAQYANLDVKNGTVKEGAKLKQGDCIIAAVRKTELSAEDKQLGRLHKTLVRNYVDASQAWEKEVEGTVKDVIVTPGRITVTVLTQEPAKLGDKIAGMYGNKGVIGRIIPDSDMVQDENGEPIDLLFTSAGVISRINPAQITASALGKAAKKQGKIIKVKNFDKKVKDNVSFARNELKKAGFKGAGLNGKETVTDPVTGKKIPNIFVGQNYILKLFKTTESNFAARNIGGYDSLEQPLKGGDRASKSTGNLEVNALLAHNARGYMADVANIKSQENGEYWRAVQMGYPPPAPKQNAAFSKFTGMLRGAGIKLDEQSDNIVMSPMTDKDVLAMSNGEIKNEKRVRSKDLRPEEGGLFDEAVTGGLTGAKWAHIDLGEPIVNPMFFEPVRRLLGKSKVEMERIIADKDGSDLRDELNRINIPQKLASLKRDVRKKKGAVRDNIVKQIKYLQSLQKNGLKAGDAYTLSKFPVIPPKMRPLLPAGNNKNTLIVDDANFLYRDLTMSKRKFQDLKNIPGMPREFVAAERKQMYDAMKAVAGLGEPVSPQSQSRKAKGFIKNIAGTNPKSGFFQKKVIKRKADLTGSATVALNPKLGVDEVEVPEDIGWRTYQPFILKRLVQQGMTRQDAMKAYEDKTPLAKQAMLNESKERPMIINRAPTLHRWGMLGVKPKFIKGKTIRVNPYLTSPMNMDFDGDSCKGFIYQGFTEQLTGTFTSSIDREAAPDYIMDSGNVSTETNVEKGDDMSFVGKILEMKVIDIARFPRIEESKTVQENGNIIYDVPENVVVPAVDEHGNWGVHRVTKFSIHPHCEEWVTQTLLQREMTTSADHSLVSLDDETLELVKTTPRDALHRCIPTLRGYDSKSTEATSWMLAGEQSSGRSKKAHDLVDSIRDSWDVGWFLGTMVGDGWVSTRPTGGKQVYLSWGEGGEEVAAEYAKIAKEIVPDIHVGGISNPHEFEGKKCLSHKVVLSSVALGKWVESTGIGHGAGNKRLPENFLGKSQEFRRGLFCGLMDTDGTMNLAKNTKKNRKYPMFTCAYTTISADLASDILMLAMSLGLHGSITESAPRKDGRQTSYSVSFSNYPIVQADWIQLKTPRKQEALEETRQREHFPGRIDIVPLPVKAASELKDLLRKAGGTKKANQPRNKPAESCYSCLCRITKKGQAYITREQFKKASQVIESLEKSDYFKRWQTLCENEEISWDYVVSAEATGKVMEMYDITVPGVWTFTMDNGAAVWDTAILSVPVSEQGKKDVHNMMLSKQLFSDKQRGDLLAAPVHESVFGWAKATEMKPGSKTVRKFKNVGEAVNAYKTGQLGEADLVDFD